ALPRPDTIDVTWSYAGGDLRFVGVFGGEPFALPKPPGRVVWRSPAVTEGENGSLVLPAWSGMFVKEVR
ncbi:hypothetical protein QR79_30155, partial [Methylobacterium indicum]